MDGSFSMHRVTADFDGIRVHQRHTLNRFSVVLSYTSGVTQPQPRPRRRGLLWPRYPFTLTLGDPRTSVGLPTTSGFNICRGLGSLAPFVRPEVRVDDVSDDSFVDPVQPGAEPVRIVVAPVRPT